MKFTQLINDRVSVQMGEEKGRRGKLQLHGFHLTAAAKSMAVLRRISRARRARKTVPITVSPITGHSTATAVNTRRVMADFFVLIASHQRHSHQLVVIITQLWLSYRYKKIDLIDVQVHCYVGTCWAHTCLELDKLTATQTTPLVWMAKYRLNGKIGGS
ncbi:hypothetical protein KUCAC02_002245%2C partial [Scomber scombrus]|uniref:Uncharacterized protein n=1 Tax=Scomber scombrus TaxID=13677 RepID=A0AAV1NK68_SCOSC